MVFSLFNTMTLLSWVLVFVFGFVVMNSFSFRFTLLDIAGLSFPLGIGLLTLLLFVHDLLGISLRHPLTIQGTILLITVVLFILNRKKFSEIKTLSPLHQLITDRKEYHLTWTLLLVCIIVVTAMIVIKGQYWPVFIYDSIAGYDFFGRAIAFEGTLNNSLFDRSNPLYTVRDLYPPLIPLAFSYAYATGNISSQIVISLFVISLVVSFYGILLRFTTHFAAAFFTLFLIITPQLASFASLSSSSLPCTYYSSMGLLYLYMWFRETKNEYFITGTLLIVLALWTRSEAIAFAAAGFIIIILQTIKSKRHIYWIVYSICCVIIFFTWQLFLSFVLQTGSEQPIIRHLYFDPEKFSRLVDGVKEVLTQTELFGFVFIAFVVAIAFHAFEIIRKREMSALLLTIAGAFIFLLWIYYQIDVDYKDANSLSYLSSGFVRSLLSLLPLLVFYIAVSNKVVWVFSRIRKWLE